MATDVMIQASELSKSFGAVRALDRVSFEVERGEVVGFLGPNGAGKSTTMRILTCFISPSSGSAKVKGNDVFDNPLEVRESLGYLPQRAPLYTDMTVYDYLEFTARVRGLDEGKFKTRLKKVVEVCGLAQSLNKDIGTLSHGFRQRVGLGQALIHDPPILILDEPTSDLDPNEKAEVLRYIKEIGKDRTILLSTHNLAEVEEACARAIIVSKGRIVADGQLENIRSKTGSVRYIVTIDEQNARKNGASFKPPTAAEALDALQSISGAQGGRELPTDETAHKFELTGDKGGDLRREIFQLAVDKGWILLELKREAQSLDAVFRDLTRKDEALDRGEEWDEDEDEDEDEETSDEDEDEESDEDADEDEDEESDEDEDEDEETSDSDEDDDEDEDEDDKGKKG
jgi:ABC-2 type transport system ATP-binding protein